MKRLILLLVISIVGFSSVPAAALTADQLRVLDSGVLYFNTEQSSVCNNVGIVNGSVDRFLQVLAYQESSGNPLADAEPASSASGKYQYLNSTWAARKS